NAHGRKMMLKVVFNSLHSRSFEMFVCVCKAVCTRTLRRVIAEGAEDLAAVGRACGAGTDCGACHAEIERMIAAEAAVTRGTRRPAGAPSPRGPPPRPPRGSPRLRPRITPASAPATRAPPPPPAPAPCACAVRLRPRHAPAPAPIRFPPRFPSHSVLLALSPHL